ncbi:DNA-binding protein [Cupriavidus metallidurans]|jgi:gp16 family phage-associated protein|uniref:DNA-binding protein n=1 Tax=Cupriavidus metallidurans TaxID=119219 RepID=A0A482IPJ3_9BURK|nr:DNA-binding protein [Cupriavidus metallidurans]QBP10131.1 DNA-binding protein [Cupriavidus metallidurans]QWC87207.1 DNA-binding protein [Cupriavidus metallidurans]
MSATKTLQQVRDEFISHGQTARSWAKAHGFHESTVYEVLAGRKKGLRGQAHEVAVSLGIKRGVIVNEQPPSTTPEATEPPSQRHASAIAGD